MDDSVEFSVFFLGRGGMSCSRTGGKCNPTGVSALCHSVDKLCCVLVSRWRGPWRDSVTARLVTFDEVTAKPQVVVDPPMRILFRQLHAW